MILIVDNWHTDSITGDVVISTQEYFKSREQGDIE